MALVEQELAGGEAGKAIRACALVRRFDFCGESAQAVRAALPFPAGQRDVGTVRARFGLEAAGRGGGNDALLEREESRRGLDAEVKDSCALEDAEAGEVDGHGRGAQSGEARDQAVILVGGGCAEELEGDVPRFRRGPAQIGSRCAQALGEPGELSGDGLGQG